MRTKTYLYANIHATAGLVFSWVMGEGKKNIWGFRAGWPDGRFMLRQLIETYGKEDGIKIYNAYNQALLDVSNSWMVWEWIKVWSIVLYSEENPDDNNISLSEQWS